MITHKIEIVKETATVYQYPTTSYLNRKTEQEFNEYVKSRPELVPGTILRYKACNSPLSPYAAHYVCRVVANYDEVKDTIPEDGYPRFVLLFNLYFDKGRHYTDKIACDIAKKNPEIMVPGWIRWTSACDLIPAEKDRVDELFRTNADLQNNLKSWLAVAEPRYKDPRNSGTP